MYTDIAIPERRRALRYSAGMPAPSSPRGGATFLIHFKRLGEASTPHQEERSLLARLDHSVDELAQVRRGLVVFLHLVFEQVCQYVLDNVHFLGLPPVGRRR